MAAGTVYIDSQFRDLVRGNVITIGRVLLGNNDILNASDVGLKRLRAISLTPWTSPIGVNAGQGAVIPGSTGSTAGKNYRREFASITGSIGSWNQISTSYARVRSWRVRQDGTWQEHRTYIGTQAGSFRASYIAHGD